MKIGLDFDRVLFDTDRFDSYYKKSSGLYHVEEDVYDGNGNYDPAKHAEVCGISVDQVWDAVQDLEKFLYSDIAFLNRFDGHELIIVTRGNQKFQKRKVEASNIEKFVDDVVIVENGPKDQAEIDFLVDDREEELEQVEVPGIKLERPAEGLKKVVEKVNDFEA